MTVNVTEQTLSLLNDTLYPGNTPAVRVGGVTQMVFDPVLNRFFVEGVYSNSLASINATSNAPIGGFTPGPYPQGFAVNPTSDLVYVADSGSDNVSVVNGSTDQVVTQIPVGGTPSGIALDPSNNRLFVSDYSTHSLSVINLTTDNVTANLSTGSGPNGVLYLPSNNEVYVANYFSANLSVYNATSLTNLSSIRVGGGPLTPVFDQFNSELYVANVQGSTVSVVNSTNNSLVATVLLPASPVGVAFNPVNNTMFLLSIGNVEVVNASTQTVIASVTVPVIASSILWDPAADDVYVTDSINNTVAVLNGANGTLLALLGPFITPDGLAFDPTTSDVYIADQGSSLISVVDPVTRAVVDTLDLSPTPSAVAPDLVNGTVFVGDGCAGVGELNTTTDRITRCLNLPGSVAGLADDPTNGRLYVSDGYRSVWAVNPVNGSIVNTINSGNSPYVSAPEGMALVPTNGTLVVANYYFANVSVVNVTTDRFVTSLSTSAYSPYQVAFDPQDGSVWVTVSSGSGVVDRYNGTTYATLPSVAVRSYPEGIVYDPSSGQMFVTGGTSTVTAINAATGAVVANISVGTNDQSLALDPLADMIVCANSGSNNVSFIDGQTDTVVGSVPVGLGPSAVAFATGSGQAVVSDESGGALTVLNITVHQPSLFPAKFNETGLAPGTLWSVTVNGSARQGYSSSILFSLPNGTYSYSIGPVTGYTASPNSGTITVIGGPANVSVTFVPRPPSDYAVDFSETGLPIASAWSVSLGGTTLNSTGPQIDFTEQNGTYAYSVASPTGYLPSPASGDVDVAGASQGLAITFSPPAVPKFPVSFTESGLPSDTVWTVRFANSTVQSNLSAISFDAPNGTYSFAIASEVGYLPTPASGNLTVSGTPQAVTVVYRASTSTTYSVNFVETGLSARTEWSVTLGSATAFSSTDQVSFTETNGSYSYAVALVPGFSPVTPSGTVTVSGSGQTVPVTYQPIPTGTYAVTFLEAGLATGTNWSVKLGGSTLSSGDDSIQFTEPNGTYRYTILPVAGRNSNRTTGNLTVSGGPTLVLVGFAPIVRTYEITFTEVGLPAGESWTVTLDGTPRSSTNSTVVFSDPNGTYSYAVSPIAGYSVTVASSSLTVAGAPQSVSVTFTVTNSGGTGTGGNGFNVTDWILVGVVLLVVVGVVVYLGTRRRGGGHMTPGNATSEPATPEPAQVSSTSDSEDVIYQ